MPTCRFCGSVYPRGQFIHGNGPKAQVCVRCGVEKGMVREEEVPSFYNKDLANSRFSHIARYWSPLLWLAMVWVAWVVLLFDTEPWWLYTLVILIIATLVLPAWMFLSRVRYLAGISHLTPDYEVPPGH